MNDVGATCPGSMSLTSGIFLSTLVVFCTVLDELGSFLKSELNVFCEVIESILKVVKIMQRIL